MLSFEVNKDVYFVLPAWLSYCYQVLFSASSPFFLCQHDNSWTAALSLMKSCMYLDNL